MRRPSPQPTLFPYTTLFRSQAFLYAINRKAIVDAVEKGYGKVANTAIPPALASYYDSSQESKYPYDPDQAKKLDRKSTRLNSSHRCISYAVFCLKKKMDEPD